MSTSLHAAGQAPDTVVLPARPDFKCVIIKAQWNNHITEPLAQGAREHFALAGVTDVETVEVPGAVELVYAAARIIDTVHPDAVIIIGCVIRGDTPHFDYVCENVTLSTARLNARGDVPVIFGLLTVDTEQQALDRAGGILGNKGTEAAMAAIQMANLAERYKP